MPTDDPADTADPTDDDSGAPADPGSGTDPKDELAQWKSLARKHERRARENADAAKRLKELEDSGKTEIERLTSQAAEAVKRAERAEAEALRMEVALDRAPDGMPVGQIRKLAKRLTGETREDLEADADELFADFVPAATGGDGEGDGDNGGGGDGRPPSRKPVERLKGGTDPEADPELSVEDVLAKVPRL